MLTTCVSDSDSGGSRRRDAVDRLRQADVDLRRPGDDDGSGTTALTLRGTISDLGSAFANGFVRYQDDLDANGSRTLHVAIDDEGNTAAAR